MDSLRNDFGDAGVRRPALEADIEEAKKTEEVEAEPMLDLDCP